MSLEGSGCLVSDSLMPWCLVWVCPQFLDEAPFDGEGEGSEQRRGLAVSAFVSEGLTLLPPQDQHAQTVFAQVRGTGPRSTREVVAQGLEGAFLWMWCRRWQWSIVHTGVRAGSGLCCVALCLNCSHWQIH